MIVQQGDAQSRTQPVPRGRAISGAAFLALRSALQGCHRRQPAEGEIRRALRLLCQAAKRDGAEVEHLLIVVKEALTSAADACEVPYGHDRDAFSRRAISMCIQEFYADGASIPLSDERASAPRVAAI